MEAEKLLEQLTLEEKAGLCSGRDFWNTKAVDRLQVKSLCMSDGSSGLRKQTGSADHLGINASVEAVAFPSAC